MADNNELFQLLNLSPSSISLLDGNAIIDVVRREPKTVAKEYEFTEFPRCVRCYPLHQAVRMKASIDVVETIYNSYPHAIQEKCAGFSYGIKTAYTALQLSINLKAPREVVLFLISKWPEAVQEKGFLGYTPLHAACLYNAPREVLSSLLNSWPDGVKEKAKGGMIPLHVALKLGRTPTVENISLLIDHYPDGLKEIDDVGCTPLHSAADNKDVSLDAILFLLEKYPGAIVEKDNHGLTPLEFYWRCEGQNNDVHQVLSLVYQLYSGYELSNDRLKEMIEFFTGIEWWNGIYLILDRDPAMLNDMEIDSGFFPKLCSALCQNCRMKTMWEVVRNKLDIMEGA